MNRTWRGRGAACAVLAAGSAMALPSPAAAHHIKSVTLAGEPVVGTTLTATVVLNDPAATLEYRWQRCTSTLQRDCERIPTAPNLPSYTIVAADKGARLALRVVATAGGDSDAKWSDITAVVTEPPAPAPTPSPTPTPTPEPDPTADPATDPDPDPPSDEPSFDQSGGAQSGSATPRPAGGGPADLSPGTLRYLRPFPVVRVKGTLVAGGARVSLLRVKAPASATVEVRCTGPGCRVHQRFFGSRRIGVLERFLRARARITIRVTKPATVGKYVRLVIRDGTAPKRRDACLLPGDPRPAPCPSD